jgi:membrane protein YqaA with SNARE-associated domain|tara:strand:+ start:474 stop:1082 length:609 start_codon:yes stop_codon:yes gene_type:complete
MSWKETIVEWFDGFGWISLAAMSFTEAIIQPVPPDLLFLPMLVAAQGDSFLVFWLWIVVTVTSVLGSIVGYWIGKKWGRPLFTRFKAEKHLEKIEALSLRYGTIGTFIAAFSPIPYKVFGWAAGMGEMEMKPFIIAGLLGRGLRFGLEAILIGIYGQKALDAIWWLLDREVLIGIALIVMIVVAWLGIRWWNGLTVDPNIHE